MPVTSPWNRRASAAGATERVVVIKAEGLLRQCLVQEEPRRIDGPALENALLDCRLKGGNEDLLAQGEKRLALWRAYVDRMAKVTEGVQTWCVSRTQAYVDVRVEALPSAPVLMQKQAGEVFRGTVEGDWVALCDISGYVQLSRDQNGQTSLEPFAGAEPGEGCSTGAQPWVAKFFAYDRFAREALTFLSPASIGRDLCLADTSELGMQMYILGRRLYDEGSLPGNPTWEKEESPEFVKSVECWATALAAPSSEEFHTLVQKAARLAEEAYAQLGNLAPRLAGLRWNCCMTWLAARSEAVCSTSLVSAFKQMSREKCDQACRKAKNKILNLLRSLTSENEILTIFDYDLVGHGVWYDAQRLPLPPKAVQEWYRRGIEFDLIMLCQQAQLVPPEDLNDGMATLVMVQPYLTPNWILTPPESCRHILEKHHWVVQAFPPPIDNLHTKALVQGPVLHIDVPPEYEHDFDDADVVARAQRGEDLGKGLQADGLPGAIHPSVALLYSAMFVAQKVENVRVYPELLRLEGFLETLLLYGPPLTVIELAGAEEAVTREVLQLLPQAGDTLAVLDLSDCNLSSELLDTLIDVVEQLPVLSHLDVGENQFDLSASIKLVSLLCQRRIDISSIRLDGNPIGNVEEFKSEVAAALVSRGTDVIAGGEIVIHLEDDMIRWCPGSRDGTLAQRIQDTLSKAPVPSAIAIKDIRNAAQARARQLDKFEQEHPEETQTSHGRNWLRSQREATGKVLSSPLVQMYSAEIKKRVAAQEEAAEARRLAEEKAAREAAEEATQDAQGA